jgi:hypothetical protein
MRKFLALFLFMSTVFFVGCNSNKTVDPEVRSELENDLKLAMENTRDLEEGSFVFDLDGQLDLVDLQQSNQFKFDTQIDLSYGNVDSITRMRDILLGIAVNYVFEDIEESVLADLMITDNTLFVKLDSLPTAMAAFGMNEFTNQWIKFDIDNDFTQNPLFSGIVKDSNLEEESEVDKELRDLYYDTDFFSQLLDLGAVNHNGSTHNKYEVIYNNQAIYDYFVRSAEILDEDITEEDLENMKKILDDLVLNMQILVSEEGLISQMSGVMELNAEDQGNEIDLELNFEVNRADVDAGFNVVAPDNAIDLMSMFNI